MFFRVHARERLMRACARKTRRARYFCAWNTCDPRRAAQNRGQCSHGHLPREHPSASHQINWAQRHRRRSLLRWVHRRGHSDRRDSRLHAQAWCHACRDLPASWWAGSRPRGVLEPGRGAPQAGTLWWPASWWQLSPRSCHLMNRSNWPREMVQLYRMNTE